MAAQPTFRELNEQLETVMVKLQAEDVDVDEALKLHAEGSKLLEQLEKRLASAEHTVAELKSKKA
jgi:exodeoxyribonuclease VII small subunit